MLVPIPALHDNYIWLYRRENLPAIIVDLPETASLFAYLEANPMPLEAVLLTHFHDDHTQGIKAFKTRFPDVPIFGPEECLPKGAERLVSAGVFATEHYQIEALACAGHTANHVAYLVDGQLFCGDALFSVGCGRVFTGDYAAAFAGLSRFKTLPDDTLICPAHEYTQGNIAFAKSLQKPSPALLAHETWVNQQRDANLPSLPTTLALEKNINPFLQAADLAEFRKLRQLKDEF